MFLRLARLAAACLLGLTATASPGRTEPVPPDLYAGLRWRMIGPFRGGRTVARPACPASRTSSTSASTTAASGRPPTPAASGSRSSTTSRPARSAPSPSRRPIPTSSTSAAARACSGPICPPATASTNPRDGGKTWKNVGLRDGQQISAILVDPTDPDRVFVAVLGHPYGANKERGVFRTTDGGKTWKKVLYKDENTGAVALAFDPARRRGRSTRRCGPRGRGRGRTAPGKGRAAACTSPPTAARPGSRSPKGCPPWRRVWDASASASPRAIPSASTRGRCPAARRSLPLRRRRRKLEARQRRAARLGTRLRLRGSQGRSQEQGHRLRRQHLAPTAPPTAGKTFAAFKGAPGGDDYHTVLDQSGQSGHHPAGRRSGRHRSPSTAARPGVPGTTSRPRSSITSSPTISFPTGSTAGSRRAARPASSAAATTGRSPSATGIPSASRSTATSPPIRCIPTSSTAAR